MTKPILLGLHGLPRCGKDTLAIHLINKHNLERFGPSVPVKDVTAVMFNIPRYYLDDDTMKDELNSFWNLTYRQMAQMVGKESSRDVFGEDFWMRHVEKRLVELEELMGLNIMGSIPSGMILADIRYENEVHWVKKHGGIMIYIIRDNLPVSSGMGHAAEAGLCLELADYIVYNNGTIEDLYQQVDNLNLGQKTCRECEWACSTTVSAGDS